MRTQPAVDTGGIRRQFFTDVLHHFAHKDTKAMFVGPQERLRPDYSSQVEPFMKILGTIIVHSKARVFLTCLPTSTGTW